MSEEGHQTRSVLAPELVELGAMLQCHLGIHAIEQRNTTRRGRKEKRGGLLAIAYWPSKIGSGPDAAGPHSKSWRRPRGRWRSQWRSSWSAPAPGALDLLGELDTIRTSSIQSSQIKSGGRPDPISSKIGRGHKLSSGRQRRGKTDCLASVVKTRNRPGTAPFLQSADETQE